MSKQYILDQINNCKYKLSNNQNELEELKEKRMITIDIKVGYPFGLYRIDK